MNIEVLSTAVRKFPCATPSSADRRPTADSICPSKSALNKEFLERLPSLTFQEIAQEVGALFAGDEIPAHELKKIVAEAFNFPVPLVTLSERLHIS